MEEENGIRTEIVRRGIDYMESNGGDLGVASEKVAREIVAKRQLGGVWKALGPHFVRQLIGDSIRRHMESRPVLKGPKPSDQNESRFNNLARGDSPFQLGFPIAASGAWKRLGKFTRADHRANWQWFLEQAIAEKKGAWHALMQAVPEQGITEDALGEDDPAVRRLLDAYDGERGVEAA